MYTLNHIFCRSKIWWFVLRNGFLFYFTIYDKVGILVTFGCQRVFILKVWYIWTKEMYIGTYSCFVWVVWFITEEQRTSHPLLQFLPILSYCGACERVLAHQLTHICSIIAYRAIQCDQKCIYLTIVFRIIIEIRDNFYI